MDTLNMKTICYWQDGYFIDDVEEAELLDRVDAFGSYHTKIELPEDADIQSEVNQLISMES